MGKAVSPQARRERLRGVAVEHRALEVPLAPSEVQSKDVVRDSLEHGRWLLCLTIVDDYTKKAIDIPVDHGISGDYVTRVLVRVGAFDGLPQPAAGAAHRLGPLVYL